MHRFGQHASRIVRTASVDQHELLAPARILEASSGGLDVAGFPEPRPVTKADCSVSFRVGLTAKILSDVHGWGIETPRFIEGTRGCTQKSLG